MATFEHLLKEVYTSMGGTDAGLGDFQVEMLLRKVGIREAFSQGFFKKADTSGDKKLNFEELLKALNKSDPGGLEMAEAVIRYKFKKLDKDGSQTLTSEELKDWLKKDGKPSSDDDVLNVEINFDADFDGEIDVEEFLDVYRASVTEKMSHFDQRMRSIFNKYNDKGDGLDSFRLRRAMIDAGVFDDDNASFEEWHKKLDWRGDGDGKLNWKEFKAAFEKIEGQDQIAQESDLRFQFMKMDKDGSGKLSVRELRDASEILFKVPGLERHLMYALGLGDDKIDYKELIAAWRAAKEGKELYPDDSSDSD